MTIGEYYIIYIYYIIYYKLGDPTKQILPRNHLEKEDCVYVFVAYCGSGTHETTTKTTIFMATACSIVKATFDSFSRVNYLTPGPSAFTNESKMDSSGNRGPLIES